MEQFKLEKIVGYKKGKDFVVDMPYGAQVVSINADKRSGKTTFTVLSPVLN